MVLSMRGTTGRADVSGFVETSPNKWFQGVVQSVTNFGLFVRPAGNDAVGLVHNSRVPRELTSALKKLAPVSTTANKTDVEQLFSEGDIIRCRVQSVDAAAKKLELSMLPFRSRDDDDDVVIEGREDEEESADVVEEEPEEVFDAQSTLIWWRGKPYQPQSAHR